MNRHANSDGQPRGCPSVIEEKRIVERRRSESNRRIKVLQTSALPLGYAAGGEDEGGRRKDEVKKQAVKTSPCVLHPSAFILATESGRRDLNPRLRPWQGRTLPLSYSRGGRSILRIRRLLSSEAPGKD